MLQAAEVFDGGPRYSDVEVEVVDDGQRKLSVTDVATVGRSGTPPLEKGRTSNMVGHLQGTHTFRIMLMQLFHIRVII